jgi:hypothetical protein
MALQERDAELAFQLVDLAGEGGLGQMRPDGGAGETPRVRDGDEVPEIPKEHRTSWPCACGIEAQADRYFRTTDPTG